MYEIEVSDRLKRILKKIFKKDRNRYEITIKKINEIVENPFAYKPLKHPLENCRRVHIDSHFVLVFRIDEKKKAIVFIDFDHHDNIYKRK